jgi:hypothetical protein
MCTSYLCDLVPIRSCDRDYFEVIFLSHEQQIVGLTSCASAAKARTSRFVVPDLVRAFVGCKPMLDRATQNEDLSATNDKRLITEPERKGLETRRHQNYQNPGDR